MSAAAVSASSLEALFARIALEEAGIETLVEQRSDSLDFHDLSVATIRRMLAAAYDAGQRSTRERI